MKERKCTLPDCELPLRYAELCNRHYLRKMRHGDPYGSNRKPPQTLQERFDAKVFRRESGCWEWSGGHFKATGYAMFSIKRADGRWAPTVAHRVSYELYVGAIPPGLPLDHLCRNRGCVNPDHLEAVPQRINMLRGDAPSAIAVRENRCQRGHEFTPDNTHVKRDGRRECRQCARDRDRRRRPPKRPLRKS